MFDPVRKHHNQGANVVYRQGGVFVINGTGKIELDNTLAERLHMLETDALPTVRATLFGENENRKFRD